MKNLTISIILCLVQFSTSVHAQNNDQPANRKDSVYFGPVIKTETLGMVYFMPQILTAVEYFVHPRVSMQESFGPMFRFKAADIENREFRDYKGFGLGHEFRYYVFNDAWKAPQNNYDSKMKTAYAALEVRYTYAKIDAASYYSYYYKCQSGNCDRSIQKDGPIYRHWLGAGAKFGFHFIFTRLFCLDLNAGIGYRYLHINNKENLPTNASMDRIYDMLEHQSVDLKPRPYITLGVLIGIDLKGIL